MAANTVRSTVLAGMLYGFVATATAFAQSVAVMSPPETATKTTVVTLNVRDMSLERVLMAISQQAGLKLYVPARSVLQSTVITMHVSDVPASEAFATALVGTGLRVSIRDNTVVLSDAEPATMTAQGIVVGKIIDGKTQQPIHGAAIVLDRNSKGVVSGDDGRFRIINVTSGPHVAHVKMLGFGKVTKTITVVDGETVSVDVTLEPSVNALDQVVVTGTVVPTEMKAIPNAMTVITAKELEERGITHIDQLFRGDVPGVWALNQGSGNVQPGKVVMTSRGSATSTTGDSRQYLPIKTYVDGVELSDPSYLGLIDPKSIERIEILPGPQASTIYGSNAINGVMQVYTKRGTSAKPQLTLNLESGFVQSNLGHTTPQHDYAMQLSGVDAHLSYNGGGSWTYLGPWAPSVHTSTRNGFGGVRYQQNGMSADISLRRTFSTNWQRGSSLPGQTWRTEQGLYAYNQYALAGQDQDYTSTAQTLGLSLTYAPVTWWSHTVTLGWDNTNTQQITPVRGYYYLEDTLLSFLQGTEQRQSLTYTTALHLPLTSHAQLTLTGGGDGWQALSGTTSASGSYLTGQLGNLQYSRIPSHNRGAFVQGQVGVRDALFFTYGVRMEWNPSYGDDANPNVVPRYGVAYTIERGPLTAKLRGSYGHATLIPFRGAAIGQTICEAQPNRCQSLWIPGFGKDFYQTLPNPNLVPQQQSGGDGGIDVYFGGRGSLTVTRYDQLVRNEIFYGGGVDSIMSIIPANQLFPGYSSCDTCRFVYHQSMQVNIGSVRNDGWTLESRWTVGPFTANGTYSWTKSRVALVSQKAQVLFPWIVKGASFEELAEHTFAFGLQYAMGKTLLRLNVQGQGQTWSSEPNQLYSDDYNRRLSIEDLSFARWGLGVDGMPEDGSVIRAYALADLNASQQLAPHVDGIIQIQNVFNSFQHDALSLATSMGRQGKVGFRVRW